MTQEATFRRLYETQRAKIDYLLKTELAGRKPRSLYEPVVYILNNPGKRLRPFLVLLAAHAACGTMKKAYNAALALEMLHTFTLAHDDIMDNADKRRGHLTLHKKYDLSTAILAGDSLLSVAYEYLLKDLGANAPQVIQMFTRSLIEVCEGQSLDKEFESRPFVSLEEYIVMITKKTAIMVETCCAIGAMVGGAEPNVVRGLRSFGKNIGIAFQIQDDLLDITADEEAFGKKIGGDLIEGKKTFLYLKALEKAKGRKLALLRSVTRNKGIAPEEVEIYKDIYNELGVPEDARGEIRRYTRLALRALHVLPREDSRALFTSLANVLIQRTR